MMHVTKQNLLRKLAQCPSTLTGLRAASTARQHMNDLIESGHVIGQMNGKHLVYSLTEMGKAWAASDSEPPAPIVRVPPRKVVHQPCKNVAPWLKAPALRPGADDFLDVPSRRSDGLVHRNDSGRPA